MKTQEKFAGFGPNGFKFCVPIGVQPRNETYFATVQFVFEGKFNMMDVDWAFNGKGVDYKETSKMNVVTLVLHDYHGQSFHNWSTLGLSKGIFSGVVHSDKKLLKVLFSVFSIQSDLVLIKNTEEQCQKVMTGCPYKNSDSSSPSSSSHSFGLISFIIACILTFLLTLCCCTCCVIIAKKKV